MLDLGRATADLFSFEAQRVAQVAGMRVATMVIAMTLLVSGVILVIASVAYFVGTLMGETWMGFAVVGGFAMMAGAGVMTWAVHSLATREDLRFPETRTQIRKDIQWLDRQLGNDEKQSSRD